jgi:proteasome accessory factor B
MRKVERLVNLIALLLDTPRPLTLDEVAEMVPGYEASGESLRRMFERDKEELRGLGVPVERAAVDAWGSEEGYFIDPRAHGMPELDLAPDERAALALVPWVMSRPDATVEEVCARFGITCEHLLADLELRSRTTAAVLAPVGRIG